MSLKIFVAGASGVIGRRLVPLLLERGYDVVGTTRSTERAGELERAGAHPVVVDVFDRGALERAIADARPEVVIHQLTDLSGGFALEHISETLGHNARVRTKGTRNLVDAALSGGVRRLIAQSIAWVYQPGPEPHRKDDPLDYEAEGDRAVTVQGVMALEEAVLSATPMEGIVLRYGWFYGPGANTRPAGTPGLHVDAAASAAVLAIARGAAGVYNVAELSPALDVTKARKELGWGSGISAGVAGGRGAALALERVAPSRHLAEATPALRARSTAPSGKGQGGVRGDALPPAPVWGKVEGVRRTCLGGPDQAKTQDGRVGAGAAKRPAVFISGFRGASVRPRGRISSPGQGQGSPLHSTVFGPTRTHVLLVPVQNAAQTSGLPKASAGTASMPASTVTATVFEGQGVASDFLLMHATEESKHAASRRIRVPRRALVSPRLARADRISLLLRPRRCRTIRCSCTCAAPRGRRAGACALRRGNRAAGTDPRAVVARRGLAHIAAQAPGRARGANRLRVTCSGAGVARIGPGAVPGGHRGAGPPSMCGPPACRVRSTGSTGLAPPSTQSQEDDPAGRIGELARADDAGLQARVGRTLEVGGVRRQLPADQCPRGVPDRDVGSPDGEERLETAGRGEPAGPGANRRR